jgi:hypothetical protein
MAEYAFAIPPYALRADPIASVTLRGFGTPYRSVRLERQPANNAC